MKKGVEIRRELIKSAIHVVSAQGIQNATTKALSLDSGLSEVYIYRYFQSKDDLFKQTFDYLDKELVFFMKRSLLRVSDKIDTKEAFRTLFHDFWTFTLGNRDNCSFFIQYYYSSYYLTHSDEERKKVYQQFLDLAFPVFQNGVDVWLELNHMYDIVFPKLLRVIRGALPDSEETEENVFRELLLIQEGKIRW